MATDEVNVKIAHNVRTGSMSLLSLWDGSDGFAHVVPISALSNIESIGLEGDTVEDGSSSLVALSRKIKELIEASPALGGELAASLYGENLAVGKNVEENILVYTVPAGKKFSFFKAFAWADVDAEYFVTIDGNQIGGGRTSVAKPTFEADYSPGMLLSEGQILRIRCLRDSKTLALPFKSNVIGALKDA